MSFAVGDKVLLSTRNLNLTGSRKFKDKFVGPFVVQQRIGEVAYRLDLLSGAALRMYTRCFMSACYGSSVAMGCAAQHRR